MIQIICDLMCQVYMIYILIPLNQCPLDYFHSQLCFLPIYTSSCHILLMFVVCCVWRSITEMESFQHWPKMQPAQAISLVPKEWILLIELAARCLCIFQTCRVANPAFLWFFIRGVCSLCVIFSNLSPARQILLICHWRSVWRLALQSIERTNRLFTCALWVSRMHWRLKLT